MENSLNPQLRAPIFGQQLSNVDQPQCPITRDTIPSERRAIVIQCSSGGMPSATIYDQRALFRWLDISHTDPCTKKPIQCVVNAKGSIIYPVKVRSDLPPPGIIPVGRLSISHRILAPREVRMSQKERDDRNAYRKIKNEAFLKRINFPIKNHN